MGNTILTLFRLSLNVASTRLILSQADAGRLIEAFGETVVGGNYIIGFIIFVIVIIIQFVVITKGSGRVAEVAARFTLDAMPGKQMAIDADLNAGLIDEGEARRRREEITREVAEVFNMLTARSEETFRQLLVAPTTLMNGMLRRIERETEHARAGRPATIIAKMNGLTDPKIIKALYHASMAGVEIYLIVRGVCRLRPGMLGISERIRVVSIIGRFLEHSRLYYFANGGNPELWAGSADWMSRNLRNRVEVIFPIEDEIIRNRLVLFLQLCLADRIKARACGADGRYMRLEAMDGEPALNMQDTLMAMAQGANPPENLPPLPGWPTAALDGDRARRA